MKKLLIVSDNHFNNIDKITNKFIDECDLLIHVGDSQFKYYDTQLQNYHVKVTGNNDFGREFLSDAVLNIGVHKLYITHGHYDNVNFGLNDLVKKAKQNECNIAIFGHTHIPTNTYIDDVLCLNPGSTDFPRGGFKIGTFLILEIDDVENIFKPQFYNANSLEKIELS